MSLGKKITDYLRLIKFSHSVFALPFAFTAALIAADGVPTLHQIFWITVAMVGGRTGAMGMNRIADRKIDALNPRTQDRELPRGVIGTRDAVIFTAAAFGLLVLAAYELNPLCFRISPFVILVLAGYSYTKRFTWLCHVFLGIALALAPLGAWIAVRGSVDPRILILSAAVMFWVAGFDALYGIQDIEFDRSHGIYSIPRVFGVRASIMIARIFHVITVALLLVLAPLFELSYIYLLGVAVSAGLLLYEHMLVRPDDLSKLDIAFFNMNGYISLTVFVFTFLHYIVG
jgi:4-hydroxybenzoate polyprenyltransferase